MVTFAKITGGGSVRLIAVLALLGNLACGYHLTGQNSLLMNNLRSIYVEPFVLSAGSAHTAARSRDVGIDKELTTAVRSEFYRRGQIKLVDQSEQADAILTGVIRSLDNRLASVTRHDEALQYEAVLVIDVTLRRREPDEILWRGPNTRLTQLFAGSRAAVVTTSSEFRTGTLNTSDVRRLTDIQLTEFQSQAAREELMERFARELHQRLVEMF